MTTPITIANALSVFSLTLLTGISIVGRDRCVASNECESGAPVCVDVEKLNLTDAFPKNWKIVTADGNAHGWKMTGFARSSMVEVESDVVKIMAEHGLSQTHRVDDYSDGENVLIEFAAKSGAKMLWMIWRQSETESGFSWGVSK